MASCVRNCSLSAVFGGTREIAMTGTGLVRPYPALFCNSRSFRRSQHSLDAP